ncbi:hypothetical protein JXD20_04385 [Candidatus Peregrinibacteria bacterium]|nr:hypothetical protein [Candidatus Peregrinibacteria bacterium]
MVDDFSKRKEEPEHSEALSAIETAEKDALELAKSIHKDELQLRRVMLNYLCAATGEGRRIEGRQQLVHKKSDSGGEVYEHKAEPVFSCPSIVPYQAKKIREDYGNVDFSIEIKQAFMQNLFSGRGDYSLIIRNTFPDVITDEYVAEVRASLAEGATGNEQKAFLLSILDSALDAEKKV